MSFSEDIFDDIDELFFDQDFFGTLHNFDGEDIVVIVDDDYLEQQNKKWKDEVDKNSVLLFVKESDMKRKLSVNSAVLFDRKDYFVHVISKQNGVWKILLGKSQV